MGLGQISACVVKVVAVGGFSVLSWIGNGRPAVSEWHPALGRSGCPDLKHFLTSTVCLGGLTPR